MALLFGIITQEGPGKQKTEDFTMAGGAECGGGGGTKSKLGLRS